MTKQVIALLPMKGHSERVPSKNMKEFNNEPLYHAVVKTLLQSKYIKKIVINTDCENIKNDALNTFQDNVIIIDRPEEIQGDYTSMNDIINYDLSQMTEEYFIQTHSTNPLLKVDTINQAIEQYFDALEHYDSLFSVTKIQTRFYDKNAQPINHNPEKLLRTQDLDPMFEENSNFYIFSKESFLAANKRRIGINPQIYEMNKLEAIDIDEPEDFLLAKLLYEYHQSL